jgi:hypothetical protein
MYKGWTVIGCQKKPSMDKQSGVGNWDKPERNGHTSKDDILISNRWGCLVVFYIIIIYYTLTPLANGHSYIKQC